MNQAATAKSAPTKDIASSKEKVDLLSFILKCTFYSAIPFIALLVILHFYYPVNSVLPHNSKNDFFCTECKNRTYSQGFGVPLATMAYSVYFCTPGQIRTVATHVKSMLLYQLSYEGLYFPRLLRGYYCLYFRFISIQFFCTVSSFYFSFYFQDHSMHYILLLSYYILYNSIYNFLRLHCILCLFLLFSAFS